MNRQVLVLLGLMAIALLLMLQPAGRDLASLDDSASGAESFTTADAMISSERWWDETVWYLLFVRSFYDSDGNGIGDIQGVIQKLDYLNDGDPNTNDDLGITGIWLMPIAEAASYHGYDTVDYRSIEQDYGSNEDFLQLMDEAHARGMRVIVDLVLNHTSAEHPWFEAALAGNEQFVDWYVWEAENPGYNGPWGAQAWYERGTQGWNYAIFWSEMPDLNHDNPEVTQEMVDIARFWLEDMHVDGFRLDAIRYLVEPVVDGRPILADSPQNRAYLGAFNAVVHDIKPDAYTVGEILVRSSSDIIARYTEDEAVDAAFEFALAEDIIGAASFGNKRDIERQLETTLRAFEPGQFAIFTTNHDEDRLLTQLGEDVGSNRVAANLLLTLPGSPFIYYGEEIGMTGSGQDENKRRPLHWDDTPETGGFTTGTPWQALQENFAERHIAGQMDDTDSLLSHYRNLIHLRNAQPALQLGETLAVESTWRSAWGYLRYTDDETLLVVLNLDNRESQDYHFTIEAGPLSNVTEAELIFSTEVDDIDIALPQVTEAGGFTDYVPIAAPLPPFSLYVIRLS